MRATSWLGYALLSTCGPLCAVQYSLIELPKFVSANGLNDHGDVVGISALSADSPSTKGVYYQHSSRVANQLALPGEAFGISDRGQMAGAGRASDAFPPMATVWNVSGGFESIASPLSAASAINNTGLVVGSIADANVGSRAVLWRLKDLSETALGHLVTCGPCVFDPESSAAAINDRGHVVGSANWAVLTTPDPAGPIEFGTHAFFWENGVIKDLGTLPGGTTFSAASGINNRDEVVGSSDVKGGAMHAFLSRDGKMSDLGTLAHDPTLDSGANGINDRGEIVGSSEVRLPAGNTIVSRAFVFSDGRMWDLNRQIDPRSQQSDHVVLTDAVAINCHGWIAANGNDTQTQELHAYLLIPQVPERKDCPSSH
jgi:probable HAF family extracellular repeat protein